MCQYVTPAIRLWNGKYDDKKQMIVVKIISSLFPQINSTLMQMRFINKQIHKSGF